MFEKNTILVKPFTQLNIAGVYMRTSATPRPTYSRSSSNAAFAGRGINLQSTSHQTIHFGLCTALVPKALVLISNCKCDPPRLRTGALLTLKCFSTQCMLHIYKPSSCITLSNKKTASKSVV
jgi:hypothetical protein